ncbi:hypothetical protein I6N90_18245 [Paenibacillus sp. GSMTC-2017]|uniref:hypothetical protein n=1 Tax=Paenibacillus sp. GSMTC-2017 TaxID=2794350 RepID=UPI0018D87441|nr:hypothetical protein [Paenibacillus sp. GSMTC-2017]MBH5319742.1 hypothetical protein [Paenibacillus sp. GSMTC-2017]
MSIQEKLKSILSSNEPTNIVFVYDSGEAEEYVIQGDDGGRTVILQLLQSIDWKRVVEVKFATPVDLNSEEA